MPTVPAASRRVLSLVALTMVLFGLVAATSAGRAQAQDDADATQRRVVDVLPLRGGFLDPPVSAQIGDVLSLAAEQGSELVVLQYSSPGGVSVDLDELVERVRSSPVPVAVLVGPVGVGAQAQGAAGVLWLSAHVRAISADAVIGPLEPADLALGADGWDVAGFARDTVAAVGGDPAAVDPMLRDGATAEQLLDAGVATLSAHGLEPLLLELDGSVVPTVDGDRELRIRPAEVEVRFHSLGLVRRLLHAATTAPFIYLLLVVGLGMLLFELFQPGFGVAGIAGLVTVGIGAFGLTVLPVTWWAVALVVLGLLLYALDTAIAGFGPVTLAATASFAVGSSWFYAAPELQLHWGLVAVTTLAAFVFFVFVMTSVLRAQAGPEGVAVEDLVGKAGLVRSVLNPEGHVYIDGALWRARWTGDARRAKVGTPVRVHAVDGPVVLVDAFEPQASGASAPLTEVTSRGDADAADAAR